MNTAAIKASKIIAKATSDAKAFSAPDSINHAYLAGCFQAHIQALCAELDAFKPPRATGRNEYETTYATEGGEYVVYFDASAGSKGSWDEPAEPAEVEINSVFANGLDVICDLSDKVLERITEKCWEKVEEIRLGNEYDRGQDAYERRMEERWAA